MHRPILPGEADEQRESDVQETQKRWWRSTTIMGAVIAIAGGVLNMTPDDIAAAQGLASAAAGHLSGLATVIGGVVAIYGRVRANKRIG